MNEGRNPEDTWDETTESIGCVTGVFIAIFTIIMEVVNFFFPIGGRRK